MSLPSSSLPTPIRAIFFDLDDTLWPAGPLIAHAEQQMMAWLAQHAPKVAALGLGHLRQRRLALIDTHPHYRVDLWSLRLHLLQDAFAASATHDPDGSQAAAAMAAFAHARNQVDIYPDVLPGLARLAGQRQLGSISNGFADLQQIGIAHHFQVSLAAHQFGKAKPDPDIFHAACNAIGVAPGAALYVGDDLLLDVQGAQNAGLRAAWIQRKLVPSAASSHTLNEIQPDVICQDLLQLADWLEIQDKAYRSTNEMKQ